MLWTLFFPPPSCEGAGKERTLKGPGENRMLMQTEYKERIPLGWRNSIAGIVAVGRFLDERRKTLAAKDFNTFIRSELGLDVSAAGKLIAISKHRILSDPQYASRLPGAWAKLYELMFVPDDILIRIINDKSVHSLTKYKIWQLRNKPKRQYTPHGVIKKPSTKESAIGHIKVPTGASLLELCRTGMKLEEQGFIREEAASKVGIGSHTYRMICTVLRLENRDNLNPHDREAVKTALDKIESTRNVKRYYNDVRPIIDKVWGTQPQRQLGEKQENRRREAFNHAIVLISDTCLHGLEIDIPLLSWADKERAADQLAAAARRLAQLRGKIRRTR